MNIPNTGFIYVLGGGFATVKPIFSSLNMPFMSQEQYTKVEGKVGKTIHSCLQESMAKAADDEKKWAIANGQILPNKTPYITVVGDGSWAKRSYGHNYTSSSGAVSFLFSNL